MSPWFEEDSKAGGDNATFMTYSADATLDLDTMEAGSTNPKP
jgi:hypothetical protein